MTLRLLLTPFVSDEEQKEIEERIEKENIKEDELLVIVQKFINYSKGLEENIDVKKLKGEWKVFHRIRTGKIQM